MLRRRGLYCISYKTESVYSSKRSRYSNHADSSDCNVCRHLKWWFKTRRAFKCVFKIVIIGRVLAKQRKEPLYMQWMWCGLSRWQGRSSFGRYVTEYKCKVPRPQLSSHVEPFSTLRVMQKVPAVSKAIGNWHTLTLLWFSTVIKEFDHVLGGGVVPGRLF